MHTLMLTKPIIDAVRKTHNFINAYLSRMEPLIHEHHGFIDKSIGDAIMAALFPNSAYDAAPRF